MLCCQGFKVKNYDFTLGRLAYESLRPVQNSGNTPFYKQYLARLTACMKFYG